MIGSVHKAKVSAAVPHVEIYRSPDFQHSFKDGSHSKGRPGFMPELPVVEPANPKLGTHQRTVRLQSSKQVKRVFRSMIKIHRGKDTIQHAGFKVAPLFTVRGKKKFLDPNSAQRFAYMRQVNLIIAIATIFILNLHHDDWAAS